MSNETEWKSPDTAPKDGTQILGDFGWPWATLAAWDEYDERWVVCNLQQCPMEDGPVNTYFETDTEADKNLKRWMPLPKLPGKCPECNDGVRADGLMKCNACEGPDDI